VSLWAVRCMPRSRSLTDRGDRPAASASSSWVSPALARSCRSNPANTSPGCSATALTPLAAHSRGRRQERARPTLQAYAGQITPATLASAGQPGRPGELLGWPSRSSAEPRNPGPAIHASDGGRPPRAPGRPAGLCGSLCGPSRVVNPLAAGDGGTSRRYRPAELLSCRHQADTRHNLATPLRRPRCHERSCTTWRRPGPQICTESPSVVHRRGPRARTATRGHQGAGAASGASGRCGAPHAYRAGRRQR
jgi:hypothetical protein